MKTNFNDLIQGEMPVLVDFYATWCQPCKVQSPVLMDLSSSMNEKIKIIKIDVDKNPDVARLYQIQGVPTLAIFKNGKIIWRNSGVHSKQQLIGVLASLGIK